MSDSVKGILLMITGSAIITLNDTVTKFLANSGVPIGQLMFIRGCFAILLVALLMIRLFGRESLRVNDWRGQLARGFLFWLAAFIYNYALALLPLATAISLSFVAPLFVTALAVPMLGERVGWRRWTAVLVGFGGMLIMVRPDGSNIVLAYAMLPVIAAFIGAVRDIITRKISATETSASILMVTTVIVTLTSLPTAAVTPWIIPTPMQGGLMLLAACCMVLAHYMVIESLRLAEAGLVVPFKYTQLIWGAVIGFVIWGYMPDLWHWVGAGVVIASGIFIFYREAQLARGIKRGAR
ncbi:MAG: DMT family transporter [Alphaproteobacteria bacterium]|nr:DMT family transporter [Alphaproteobacteria bacterium]MBU0798998.1 DMT family transporter [Alphaproteobacteria bacterium]MBU0887733.1 DMT family transporter [Alphaproteobacteria bacterium]MBU1815044.1 DMT family transporter [Alphaproteobacteria bacterium]MBU2090562.1 DMT family transporter [Alphaproteobacteria bacterium]